MSKKLTIGFACFDDVEGAFFTLGALRLYHHKNLDNIELLVVDDFPGKTEGLQGLCELSGAKYIHETVNKGPARAKNNVFKHATGEYVLLLDSHVLLCENAVDNIFDGIFYNLIKKNMWVGPLINEMGNVVATHLEPKWRGAFYGTWNVDDEIVKGKMKEVPMHGAAFMLMKREHWPEFSPHFEGFAGEEGYIHEKVRMNGGKIICNPRLKWMHRFERGKPISFKLDNADRVYNYLIGFHEIKYDVNEVVAFFRKDAMPEETIQDAIKRALIVYPNMFKK